MLIIVPIAFFSYGTAILLLTSALITGLCLGSMYGFIALGFHVTHAATHTVNFSQGSAVMLGAVLGYVFAVRAGLPLAAAILLALGCCAIFGLLIERFLVRPFVQRGSNAWLMATVAGGIVVDNLVLFGFGKEPRSFPPMMSQTTVSVMGSGVYPLQLIIPCVGVVIAMALSLVLRHSRWGKAMLAVVQDAEAARLMGINTKTVAAAVFALSTAMAGLAGILIAPLFSVHSDMGTLFGLKAFAVAIVGGISSAPGVMIAGVLYGIAEALVTAFLGSSYTQIMMFSFVIVALAVMPQGLLGRASVKKV